MKRQAVLCVSLAAALALPVPVWPQQAGAPQSNVAPGGGGLKITVVQGQGVVNRIRTRTVTPPVVEVRDETDKPVAGAEVVFQLPAAGPGGTFYGWMRTETVRSDAQGRAASSGFLPNEEEGRFNIEVTATAGQRKGTIVVNQRNAAGSGTGAQAKKSRKTLWTVLGLAAAGAIAGGVAASRGNGTVAAVPAPVPVTISNGPVTVGNPR